MFRPITAQTETKRFQKVNASGNEGRKSTNKNAVKITEKEKVKRSFVVQIVEKNSLTGSKDKNFTKKRLKISVK